MPPWLRELAPPTVAKHDQALLDATDHHDAAGEEWVIAPRAVELSSVVVGVDIEVATSLKLVVAGFEASITRNPAG